MEGHLHPGEVEPFFACAWPGKIFLSHTMNRTNRRAFLQTSAGALAAGLSPAAVATLKVGLTLDHPAAGTDTALVAAPPLASNEGRKPLRVGLITGVGEDPHASLAQIHEFA